MADTKIIDADGHITEPPDLWETYLEAQYRPRAIRIRQTAEGLEYLEIDGKRHRGFPVGRLGALLCSIGQDPDTLLLPGQLSYRAHCPAGGYDPHARVQVLNAEGIDMAFLYPTIGITWEGHVEDPALAAVYCRAYNDWLLDFCRPYPDRLLPIAHISLLDVPTAVAELRRVVKRGVRGVFIRADLIDGRPHGHPDFDPFWAECQELDIPVSLHVVTREYPLVHPWFKKRQDMATPMDNFFFAFAFFSLDVVVALTSLFHWGIFERFPRLKLVVLEAGGGWIAHWLERLDRRFELGHTVTPLRHPPSVYFQRQCWISVEPDERTTRAMVELLGEDRFLWASDYPHPDASFGVVKELKGNLAGLSERAQGKILGENAARLYKL